ncbi:hypothetical protein STRCI_001288 [Streptomyces cinnabarinus]|uniref:MarR family transcriptional regulator n=1 Tax=Streptomyces cinnabarinus TaxID=67287 RepID=A0ABY7K6N9_9ACTN|nr:hypothetical protein [Streptomyces cinnabarinus]WAZ20189.1 hypothetical protein STRCI_001288 [Streptomyces cinnabarinus]
MVDRTPETVADIARRTGRPQTTVSKTWTRHPHWPAPLNERRGRWRLYNPDDVDDFIRDHIDRQAAELEPRRLYTATELENAGIGIKAATIRADRARGRWPAPDDTTDDVNRWYGATVTKALESRRGYRRGGAG